MAAATCAKTMKRIIDIGANLTDPMFRGNYNGKQKHCDDFVQMLSRAAAAGVDKMIITGGSLKDSQNALDLAKTNDKLFSTVGCHPTRCQEFESEGLTPEEYLNKMVELVNDNSDKVVAVGEFGLDYDRLHFCPKETQLKYFEHQLDISEQTNLPLFLHCRAAADDLLRVLRNNKQKFSLGVVHSFDGTKEEATEFLNMGLYIGINGCSLKTEKNLDVAREIPLEKLMIETDCPWCEVRPTHAGYKHISTTWPSVKKEKWKEGFQVKGRNEPANLRQILEIVASIREEDIDQLADALYQNTETVFFSKSTIGK